LPFVHLKRTYCLLPDDALTHSPDSAY
jgi:hypothetical protein